MCSPWEICSFSYPLGVEQRETIADSGAWVNVWRQVGCSEQPAAASIVSHMHPLKRQTVKRITTFSFFFLNEGGKQ
jgi:hypothetical protein